MKKIDLRDLIQEGQIQEEPGIGWDQVERLIKRASEDLKSAERNMPFDEPGAMDFIYKAMFHAGNALIRSYGFRPGATQATSRRYCSGWAYIRRRIESAVTSLSIKVFSQWEEKS